MKKKYVCLKTRKTWDYACKGNRWIWLAEYEAKACMCSGFSDESSDVGYKYWGRRNKARKAECNQIQKGFECQRWRSGSCPVCCGIGREGSVTQQEDNNVNCGEKSWKRNQIQKCQLGDTCLSQRRGYCGIIRNIHCLVFVPGSWHQAAKTLVISWVIEVIRTSFDLLI